MKKVEVIQELKEIWDGNQLRYHDFSNLDLSNLDLSGIPEEQWNGCIFYNTNLSNTNIKFNPTRLKKQYVYKWAENNNEYSFTSLENCNFENCDLSYLNEKNLSKVKIKGCNFRNTRLNVDFSKLPKFQNGSEEMDINELYSTIILNDVLFDENYNHFDKDHWEELCFDIKTLIANPNIHISSAKLLNLISYNLPKLEKMVTPDEINRYVEQCEKYLEFDKDGDLKRLYYLIKSMSDSFSCYRFFHRFVENINFKDVDLGVLSKKLLETIRFRNCEYDNTTIRTDIASLTSLKPPFREEVPKMVTINLPMINFGSWRDKQGNRVINTPITFRTNVYVELDRICNASCGFCRNNSFDRCEYDLDGIKHSLLSLYPYLDDIVIGGGEPALRLEDLISFRKWIAGEADKINNPNWYIFTNGSFCTRDIKKLNELHIKPANRKGMSLMTTFDFNISRHAVNDGENAKIFGVSKKDILNTRDLEWVATNTTGSTLCATCFKGGLDSFDKIIDYIKFAQSLGYRRILFSSLHKDNSSGIRVITSDDMNINNSLFEQTMAYLQCLGYERKLPIYSTGGYTSTVLFNDYSHRKFTVAFKDYITKERLENEWCKSVKRTFDLSIDPSGQVFENWHQTSGLVNCNALTMKQKI